MLSIHHKLAIDHAKEEAGIRGGGTAGDETVPVAEPEGVDMLGLDGQGLAMLQAQRQPLQLVNGEDQLEEIRDKPKRL